MQDQNNNQDKEVAPCGIWPSPLSPQDLANGNVRYGEPKLALKGLVWPESLPDEGGRTTLMYAEISPNNPQNIPHHKALLPAPWDIRSKVHEYGGGAYAIDQQTLFFVHAKNQQIYRFTLGYDKPPTPLTNAPNSRYANLVVHPSGEWLFCICESFSDKSEEHPVASVIAISTQQDNCISEIACGEDFYASICLAPDGTKGAFISWNHPNMPWDNTSLWEFDFPNAGTQKPRQLINGKEVEQSIVQPKYSQDNKLFFVSDKSNWWNLYAYLEQGSQTPLIASNAECATPQWTFGMSSWGFLDSENILFAESANGCWSLKKYNLTTQSLSAIESDQTVISHIHCGNQKAVFLCGNPALAVTPAYIHNVLNNENIVRLDTQPPTLNKQNVSIPESHWFKTSSSEEAHLWYYPPTNQHYCVGNEQRPPLIVLGHGGPTGATEAALNLKIQFWTSRGFAVADVNYRGSTGFGRKYRHRLNFNWGILDVEDLCFAAIFLVDKGLAHPQQKIIKGSSAGGFTVLAALTQHKTFDAGVSLYGVADLEALAKDTHKFEAHYLDTLIGEYPQQKAEYIKRSPISHIHNLNCPILVAQGLDDKVVPPTQAEVIVNAARDKGIDVEYLTFKNEGHGFRLQDTIIQLFETEHSFYCKTFNLKPEKETTTNNNIIYD